MNQDRYTRRNRFEMHITNSYRNEHVGAGRTRLTADFDSAFTYTGNAQQLLGELELYRRLGSDYAVRLYHHGELIDPAPFVGPIAGELGFLREIATNGEVEA